MYSKLASGPRAYSSVDRSQQLYLSRIFLVQSPTMGVLGPGLGREKRDYRIEEATYCRKLVAPPFKGL